MKYRNIFNLKGRRDDGRLIYVAKAGQWDLACGLEWWKKNHGQTIGLGEDRDYPDKEMVV
jgi:hypothetical protein